MTTNTRTLLRVMVAILVLTMLSSCTGGAPNTTVITVTGSAPTAVGAAQNPSTSTITSAAVTPQSATGPGPAIHDISTNASSYPGGQVPNYAKLEITFQVDTTAKNLQLPYTAAPPPGVEAGIGVSVDALFTHDGWATTYTQPAFYYQVFDDQVKSGHEWFYPTGQYAWMVRFTPNQPGSWQYKLVGQDASGRFETPAQSVKVVVSERPGFVRVSARDPRYFELENGSYFPGLGYNMNYNHIRWINPVLDNQQNFTTMSENGIQLIRVWLSQWAIYGSSWNPWYAIDPALANEGIPHTGLTSEEAYPGSDFSMKLRAGGGACMFIGSYKAKAAVKRNTNYRVGIRYKTVNMGGAKVSGKPSGLVAKTGGWLWGADGSKCSDTGTGTIVSAYQTANSSGWQILEGSLNSGAQDFLPNFYLVMENLDQGTAYIDYVWIQEDLGGGKYGPNIVSKPWMAQHLYMEQRNSYAFDKVVEMAEQKNIYLRPVILEKSELIQNHIDYAGNTIPDNPLCKDTDKTNDPPECPGNQWFYGNWRAVTKVRWLQQAWWRYLQARWGYSTHIQSWELLNEGDPFNGLHYSLADEFGKAMHAYQPDDHLVSTSFWHSFPKKEFWANPAYPNIDFADVHQYVKETQPEFADTALATYNLSMAYGAKQPGGVGKPVIRGETGFVPSGTSPATTKFQADSQAVWLHNFIWGQINPGGALESYFYDTPHIYKYNTDNTLAFDERDRFRPYYNFIRSVPLNNGQYQDAAAQVSNLALRAWGQKDLTNQRAHLWIQNTAHTWEAASSGTVITAISGSVQIAGLRPKTVFTVEWWDPYQIESGKQIVKRESLTSGADGTLALPVQQLTSDIAVKIELRGATSAMFLPMLRRP